ncbi:hypothetical protein GQ55_1G274600 [Panicum hallii var. hallii]|jgi:hypothetical protein|uniref:Uncharacterized protein n=2 Tax=Panicum hallii TaxID=206008 RepID=A0A2T7F879_9POAL|nr:hypothetical protein GQ55_1G274600 [Panicum hallii var. hallii]PVH66557.1 hypothetical protein PAHAL_1G279700 [Panicum hallii]
MDAHCHRLAIVVALVLLATATQEALAVRSLSVLAPSSSPDVLPSARFDTPEKKRAAAAPSAVFDPDRMSKRRVRRGSDPIHNKC